MSGHCRQSAHRFARTVAPAMVLMACALGSSAAPRDDSAASRADSAAPSADPAAPRDDLEPQTPAAFLPGGLLGIQLGGSFAESRQNPALHALTCQAVEDARDFDEVCFFKAGAASRVAGAEIHDGFIVRKDDRVVLVGTGIAIQNADDPLAESVMQSLQAQIHSAFQHTGDNVLFVELPKRSMSAAELQGFSRTAPVLLVQIQSKAHELAVLYGFLAPVNAFNALIAD